MPDRCHSLRLKRWSPQYKCKQSTADALIALSRVGLAGLCCGESSEVLQSTLATKSAGTVRRVEEGEILEVIDGPKEARKERVARNVRAGVLQGGPLFCSQHPVPQDTEAGLLRIRARARKDQAVGRGNDRALLLVLVSFSPEICTILHPLGLKQRLWKLCQDG